MATFNEFSGPERGLLQILLREHGVMLKDYEELRLIRQLLFVQWRLREELEQRRREVGLNNMAVPLSLVS